MKSIRMIEPDDALRAASDAPVKCFRFRKRKPLSSGPHGECPSASVGSGGAGWRAAPTATAVVRVLDMTKRQQVFPDPNGDGREGFVVLNWPSRTPTKCSRGKMFGGEFGTIDELLQIARLFDEYITNPLGQNLR